jgi:hypothetical protein
MGRQKEIPVEMFQSPKRPHSTCGVEYCAYGHSAMSGSRYRHRMEGTWSQDDLPFSHDRNVYAGQHMIITAAH